MHVVLCCVAFVFDLLIREGKPYFRQRLGEVFDLAAVSTFTFAIYSRFDHRVVPSSYRTPSSLILAMTGRRARLLQRTLRQQIQKQIHERGNSLKRNESV